MPISLDRFEKQQRPLGERILEVLRERSGAAWSFIEIVQLVEALANDVEAAIFLRGGRLADGSEPLAAYERALRDLRARGMVSAVTDQGLVFYRCNPEAKWTPPIAPDVPDRD